MTASTSQPATRRFSKVRVMPVAGATFLFVSGVTAGIDAPYDTVRQTELVFGKIEALLREREATLADVMKLTVFLADIREYEQYSAVRDRIFAETEVPPASTAVEGRLGEPALRIEIEAIAVIPSAR